MRFSQLYIIDNYILCYVSLYFETDDKKEAFYLPVIKYFGYICNESVCLWFSSPAIKRESGANPGQSRCCKVSRQTFQRTPSATDYFPLYKGKVGKAV